MALSPRERHARERYDADTIDHVMTVLRDDGVYRHVRFRRPDTNCYWFDLVTWPGSLAITGDLGDYVFSRTPDMFSFFASTPVGSINPGYWAEKLRAPRPEAARTYSVESYRAHVLRWLADQQDDLPPAAAAGLMRAVNEDLLSAVDDGTAQDEQDAHRLLRDFEHNGIEIGDSWEWDLREFDPTFLWCCWAIADGIQRYRAAIPVSA